MFNWFKKRNTYFLIYFYVGIIFVITFLYWFIYRTSLSENLFAGTIDLLVAVFVINRLINIDRTKRLTLINKSPSNWVSTYAGICLVKFAEKIKYEIKDVHKNSELSYADSIKLLDKIFNSKEFKAWYSGIKKYDKTTLTTLEEFNKETGENKKLISDALERIKPYPNPEVVEHLFQNDVNIMAYVMVIVEMVSGIFELGQKNPRGASGIRDIMVKLIDSSDTGRKPLDFDIKEYYKKIILLKKYSEENSLFFDL